MRDNSVSADNTRKRDKKAGRFSCQFDDADGRSKESEWCCTAAALITSRMLAGDDDRGKMPKGSVEKRERDENTESIECGASGEINEIYEQDGFAV